jgi:hypothetical protein
MIIFRIQFLEKKKEKGCGAPRRSRVAGDNASDSRLLSSLLSLSSLSLNLYFL